MTVPAVRPLPKWTCRRERQTWEKNASAGSQPAFVIKGDDQHPPRTFPTAFMSSTIYNVSPPFFPVSLPSPFISPFSSLATLAHIPVAISVPRASDRKISARSELSFLPPIITIPSIHLTSPPSISIGASSRPVPPLRGQTSIHTPG